MENNANFIRRLQSVTRNCRPDMQEASWFDVERLELRKAAAVQLDTRPTGGPQPTAPVR